MRRLVRYAAIAVLMSATSAFAATYYVAQKAGGGACSVNLRSTPGDEATLAPCRWGPRLAALRPKDLGAPVTPHRRRPYTQLTC